MNRDPHAPAKKKMHHTGSSRRFPSGVTVKFLLGLASFMAVAAAGVSVAADLAIISPPDKAVVESSTISITIRVTERSADEIRVTANGRQALQRKVPPGQSYLCGSGIKLQPGENAITVTGSESGKETETQTLSVFYRTDLSALDIPGGFRKYEFHGGNHDEPCRRCHRTAFRGIEENPTTPADSPCFTCHRSLTAGYKLAHGPSAVWSCTACHAVSADGTLPADDSSCTRCHDDTISEWAGSKYRHGPAEAGKCTTCHNPHASDQAAFLRLSPADLCRSCHEETAARPHVISTPRGGHPTFLSPNPFQPSSDLTCVSCHNPHAGKVPFFLKNGKSGIDFCKSCHRF